MNPSELRTFDSRVVMNERGEKRHCSRLDPVKMHPAVKVAHLFLTTPPLRGSDLLSRHAHFYHRHLAAVKHAGPHTFLKSPNTSADDAEFTT